MYTYEQQLESDKNIHWEIYHFTKIKSLKRNQARLIFAKTYMVKHRSTSIHFFVLLQLAKRVEKVIAAELPGSSIESDLRTFISPEYIRVSLNIYSCVRYIQPCPIKIKEFRKGTLHVV